MLDKRDYECSKCLNFFEKNQIVYQYKGMRFCESCFNDLVFKEQLLAVCRGQLVIILVEDIKNGSCFTGDDYGLLSAD